MEIEGERESSSQNEHTLLGVGWVLKTNKGEQGGKGRGSKLEWTYFLNVPYFELWSIFRSWFKQKVYSTWKYLSKDIWCLGFWKSWKLQLDNGKVEKWKSALIFVDVSSHVTLGHVCFFVIVLFSCFIVLMICTKFHNSIIVSSIIVLKTLLAYLTKISKN